MLAVARHPAPECNCIGVPISAAELTELSRRDTLGRSVGLIEAAGSTSALYGGVEVDQAAGGVVVIKIIRYNPDDEADRALATRLRTLVPAADPVAVRTTPVSEATMNRASAELDQALTSGKLNAYAFRSESVTDRNVIIGVATSAPAGTEAALHRLFPWPFLVVVRTAGVDMQPGRGRMPKS